MWNAKIYAPNIILSDSTKKHSITISETQSDEQKNNFVLNAQKIVHLDGVLMIKSLFHGDVKNFKLVNGSIENSFQTIQVISQGVYMIYLSHISCFLTFSVILHQ